MVLEGRPLVRWRSPARRGGKSDSLRVSVREYFEAIGEEIQLAPISEFAATREAAAVTVLDSGDAQAFALAATRNGR